MPPLQLQLMEPSFAFVCGVKINVFVSTAWSTFATVAVITPVAEVVILLILVRAPRETPKLLWTVAILLQAGHVVLS